MGAWHNLLQQGMDLFNLLIILYFFAANGVYTILMAASLASVFRHSRRLAYQSLRATRASAATPPVTVIIPAYNEEQSILETVHSALGADYPDVRVVVVNDGSTDETLARLTQEFRLSSAARIIRSPLPAAKVECCYASPDFPRLVVLSKVHGGKADSLNAGINFCRTPYFCILDADCLIEPDSLLRLMRPVIESSENPVVSAGVVRIRNGCEAVGGRIRRIGLPRRWIEMFQVVEYLRNFLLGRAGWGPLGGTLIVSGAMAVFERETVVDAGGFDACMVSEDMELIVRLHHRAREKKRQTKMAFTPETVCWTECPKTVAMLARQRRRWHLGLCQSLHSHLVMNFNPRFGIVGVFSFPFHLFVEGLGAAVEL
ncbi:MAG: glycosyltransferase, partial [Acidobacteriota bacterium]|nr:glycosyltransferase [Acidobacteriota bacterium]